MYISNYRSRRFLCCFTSATINQEGFNGGVHQQLHNQEGFNCSAHQQLHTQESFNGGVHQQLHSQEGCNGGVNQQLHNPGQSTSIPHSEPFSHLRCRNGSQTYLNLYICIWLASLLNYI